MSDQRGAAKTGWNRKSNRKLIALATGIAIAIGGVFGVQALANSQTYGHMKLYAGYQGGGHGGHHKGLSELSDQEIEARIERIVKHVQDRITALVTAAAKDLKPVHDRLRATGKEIHDLLLADPIDRTALEKLRTERLAEAETMSAHWLMWPKCCPRSSARCSTSGLRNSVPWAEGGIAAESRSVDRCEQ
jgi:Spy/CpxP family protein refolding chaperone